LMTSFFMVLSALMLSGALVGVMYKGTLSLDPENTSVC
jgi:hypothetical protein